MFNTNIKTCKIRACINFLKGCLPVIIYDEISQDAKLLFATEFLDNNFNNFTNDKPFLIISKEKFNFYTNNNLDYDVKVFLSHVSDFHEIKNNPKRLHKVKYEAADEIDSLIMKIMKKFEICPEFLIFSKKFSSFIDLKKWALENDIFIISYDEVRNYNLFNLKIAEVARTNLRLTKDCINAEFIVYRDCNSLHEHYAVIIGDRAKFKNPLVRVHSSCYTGDLLASLSCDCRDQLHLAIKYISEDEEGGVLIYLSQEGRGIGLANKIKAYSLQSNFNLDTVDANLALGFKADERELDLSAIILEKLNIKSVRIITNNPEKIAALTKHGINIISRVELKPCENQYNSRYIKTKSKKLGHLL